MGYDGVLQISWQIKDASFFICGKFCLVKKK